MGRRPSGHDKRQKKIRDEKFTQSQRGALDNFIVKQSQGIAENSSIGNDDDGPRLNNNGNENDDDLVHDGNDDLLRPNNNENEDVRSLCHDGNENDHVNDLAPSENEDANDLGNEQPSHSCPLNIQDPRTWDNLDNISRDMLVRKGPLRDLLVEKGPKDRFSRRFSSKYYTRHLPNGETHDRKWVVYSKDVDEVFCFCCKLFKKGHHNSQLVKDGFNDWKHLSARLSEHELSNEHITNMKTWFDLQKRLEINETIDKIVQDQIDKEKKHWNEVLLRIISIVKYLSKKNQAFRWTNEETVNEETPQSIEESFRVHYFLYIVDQTIGSLKKRFEQYKSYEVNFGFLFGYDKLNAMDDNRLEACCDNLESVLKHGMFSDLDGKDLFAELKFIREILPKESKSAIDILNFLKVHDCFPVACIAYRILLTIPVTVASAERSFSKLKLLKSYLRSTMSQERLNGLALISIEHEFLAKIDVKALISDFASKTARRSMFK